MMDEAQLFEVLQNRSGPLLRVECQPVYDVASDGGDRLRYDRGDPVPGIDLDRGWTGQLWQDSQTGREWRKVHLFSGRLTDYERFMFEWYFTRNSAAGEVIRIFEMAEPLTPQLPDWYVLDDGTVILMHFTYGAQAGQFFGAEIASPADGAPYAVLARRLWEQAADFPVWWEAHPQWHRDTARAA